MYLGIALVGNDIEFMLIDNQCHIHGFQREHMVDIMYDGPAFRGIIESGIARVCLKAGVRFDDIDFTSIAIPGYGEDDLYDDTIKKYIGQVFYHDHFLCENEIEAAWISALGGYEGIVVMAGVGSIAIGKNRFGETIRSGGWGRLAGDEGGEYWLAKKILELFTKEADGRLERGRLYHLLKDKLNLNNDTDIYNFSFHHLEYYNLTFEEFVDIIFDSEDDENVQEVLESCAKEYVMMIKSIQKQMDFKAKVKVSYVGRIFGQPKNLIRQIEKHLGEEYAVFKPFLSLVAGAALRAMMFKEKVSYYDIHRLLIEEKRLHHLQV